MHSTFAQEHKALEETQLLITRLRGMLTARITEEWVKPEVDHAFVGILKAERDVLLDQRETLGLKPLPELEELKSQIGVRLQALTADWPPRPSRTVIT